MPKVTMASEDPEENVVPEEEGVAPDNFPANEDIPQRVEDVDPSTEIWEGGPTAGQVVAWKAEHEDVYITAVTMEKNIVWRCLYRDEYRFTVKSVEKALQAGTSQSDANMDNEELVCNICILHPTNIDYNKGLAGLPSIIAQQIMEASGFNSVDVRQL